VKRCVFTGDTVFIGGCGKFFEGAANQMLSNMDLFTGLEGKEAFFPEDTLIFCGHEYAAPNL
jgi:hydroxyacylglutathione hydrolase